MTPSGGQLYWIRTSPWTSAKVMVVASQIAVVRCPARARRTRNAMPPMWTVPLRVMAGFALAAGGDGPAPVRRSAPGGRVARGFAAGGDGVGAVARSGCPGHLAGVPGLLPGDAPGQALVGALGVVDVVEAVDPSPGGSAMESARGCRPGWRSRVWWKRSLSPVGGGPVGSAGGGFDAQGAHVPRPGGPVTPRRLGLRAAPLSAARALGHAPGGYALVEDVDGRLTGLARGDQGGHRQAGVVVLEPARSPPCARRPGRTRWRRAASRRWGRGRSNRRHAALGLLDGSALATPS